MAALRCLCGFSRLILRKMHNLSMKSLCALIFFILTCLVYILLYLLINTSEKSYVHYFLFRSSDESTDNEDLFDSILPDMKANGFKNGPNIFSNRKGDFLANAVKNAFDKKFAVLSSKRYPLDIHVLENREEALPIWFGHWKQLKQPLQPLSLVQFDAFSDVDFNEKQILPLKEKLHESDWSIEHARRLAYSQRSLVQTGRLLGAIGHYQKITPNWLNTKNLETHVERVGVVETTNGLFPCSCCQPSGIKAVQTDTENCTHYDLNNARTARQKTIDEASCRNKTGPYYTLLSTENDTSVDYLVLLNAPANKNNIRWEASYGKPRRIAVDINLSYFGAASTDTLLQKYNISRSSLHLLSQQLHEANDLFTAQNIASERASDNFFGRIIEELNKRRKKLCKSLNETSYRCAKLVLTDLMEQEILEKWIQDRINVNPTANQLALTASLRSISRTLLAKFTHDQLQAISIIGICFSKFRDRNQDTSLRLCLTRYSIKEFVDSQDGILLRIERLKHSLKSLPYPPTIVTISRSSRDGTIPRHQLSFIENNLFNAFGEVSDRTRAFYSPELHFSSEGWVGNRERRFPNLLTRVFRRRQT